MRATRIGIVRIAVALMSGLPLGGSIAAEPSGLETAAPEHNRLTLEYAPDLRVEMTAELWDSLPRASASVTGPEGKETVYTGVAMAELLKLVKAPLGKELRGKMLANYVLVKAADDYRVVFALPEFDPESTAQVVLLANQRDGKPLDRTEGPYRIIVPREKKHARWIRQVVNVAIRSTE